MRKQRTLSQYHSVRHNSKQHCPEDIACRQCCKCVEVLKKQSKILMEKNQAVGKEKEDYLKEIMRLNKIVRDWEKR
jgi:hypothetical protein